MYSHFLQWDKTPCKATGKMQFTFQSEIMKISVEELYACKSCRCLPRNQFHIKSQWVAVSKLKPNYGWENPSSYPGEQA